MEILRDGTFSLSIPGEALARGLRPSKRAARNTQYLIQCVGAVGRDRVLQVIEDLESGRIDTSIITDGFPYPQIFVFINYIVVCSKTRIYTYDGSTLTLQIDVGIEGVTWSAVESYDYLYMSNCSVAVIRNPLSGEFEISDLPPARAMCNYNGQVIISECFPIAYDLYILRTGYIADPYPGVTDTAWMRTSAYEEITHYGSRGSGIDQLFCASSISADKTYVFIADWRNNRMMVRSMVDLSYMYHKADTNYLQGVHTNGDFVYAVGTSKAFKRNRADFSAVLDTYTVNPNNASAGMDLTTDDNYLYVTNKVYRRIDIYDKDTLVYVDSFGRYEKFTDSDSACYSDGTYVYTCSSFFTKVNKIRISDWTVVGSYGGPATYRPLQDIDEFGYYGGLLYLGDNGDDWIGTVDVSTMAFNEIFNYDNSDVTANSIYVDANHIYICGWAGFLRHNRTAPYAFVDSSGDFTYVTDSGPDAYSWAYAITGDATYVYVFDWGTTDPRIVRRLKTDLSYVDEYTDVANNFHDPRKLAVDGTYIYVSDQGSNEIHRINKTTMAYVDSFTPTHDNPQQMWIVGTDMYVASYDGFIDVVDLTTQTTTDSSPEYATDEEDDWMIPNGITCDNEAIYITNYIQGGSETYQNYVAKYDKTTKALLGRYDVGYGVFQPCVDGVYLYVPVREINGIFNGFMYRFLKDDLSFVDKTQDILCESIDTLLYFKS